MSWFGIELSQDILILHVHYLNIYISSGQIINNKTLSQNYSQNV